MNCPRCLKEATPTVQFGRVTYYICEFCGKKFSYSDDGQATEKELADLQRSFQEQYERHVKGFEPVKNTLSRMGVMVMHNPLGRKRPGKVVDFHNPFLKG